jgi:hypothetical protein
MAREKVLVVDHDLDHLTRIYLALIHRKFKAEACNNPEEITQRLKRFRPFVIVLPSKEYISLREKLKISAIVVAEQNELTASQLNDGDILLKKPVQTETLMKAVESLV